MRGLLEHYREFKPLSYTQATRHPLPCLLFLLPLLAAYEIGVVWVGGAQADCLRNGADTWLRWALEEFGLHQLYAVPLLLAAVFLFWSLFRLDDRPDDLLGVSLGIATESVVFGLALWAMGKGFEPFLEALSAHVNSRSSGADGVVQLVGFVGAGIYEEVLFRLLLFSGLVGLLCWVQTPKVLAIPMAAIVSAALFAAAHHIGPYGEAFDERAFLFRALAGLYFAALFQFRGFGVAVGAHALYDVLVG